METIIYFLVAFFWFNNIQELSSEEINLAFVSALLVIVVLDVILDVIYNLLYSFIYYGEYKKILKKLNIYIKTKENEVAVVQNSLSGKIRVIENRGFIFPGSKVNFIGTSIVKINLKELECDFTFEVVIPQEN